MSAGAAPARTDAVGTDATDLERLHELLAERRVSALLERAARERPGDRYASLPDGTPVTIAEVEEAVRETVAALRAHGVGPESRVAVGLANSLDHAVVILAIFAIGAVWSPLNPRLRGVPLTHVLSDTRPTHLVDESAGLVREVEASLAEAQPDARVVRLGPLPARAAGVELLALDGMADPEFVHPDDLRTIMYTSGTTGAPKGVMVTDRLLLAAVAGCLRTTECRPGDVLYVWEPLHHIGGAQVVLLPLVERISLAFGPAFDRRTFWEGVAASGASHIHYLGGVLQVLLKEPPSPAERAHSARIGWGAAATPEIWDEVVRRFGIEVHECYGATETSSIVTVNTVGRDYGIGLPVPWFEVRIDAPDADGSGELQVRPLVDGLVTPGYWRNPRATQAARDGEWWRTGDRASIGPEGQVHFIGRVADGIRVRGENLSAWQIESVYDTHPDVAKSAVVGIDSELGEQELLLFLQPVEGRAIDLAGLPAWAAERLPTLYQPRLVKLVEEFELTPSRRIAKRSLDRGPEGRVELRPARP